MTAILRAIGAGGNEAVRCPGGGVGTTMLGPARAIAADSPASIGPEAHEYARNLCMHAPLIAAPAARKAPDIATSA